MNKEDIEQQLANALATRSEIDNQIGQLQIVLNNFAHRQSALADIKKLVADHGFVASDVFPDDVVVKEAVKPKSKKEKEINHETLT